jgi:hypothetical protein
VGSLWGDLELYENRDFISEAGSPGPGSWTQGAAESCQTRLLRESLCADSPMRISSSDLNEYL